HLGNDRPFYALHAPGLYGDREPLADIEALADEYLAAIREVQPAGPYSLGGWSFGGLVAFELAQRLRAAGQEVALLALLDAVAPETHARGMEDTPAAGEEDEDDAEVIAWYAEDFLAFFGADLPQSERPRLSTSEELRALEPEERLRYLHGVATAVNGLPRDAGLEQVRRYLLVYRMNQRAARLYRPRGAYPGAVALFRAAGIPSDRPGDPALGWGPWLRGELEIRTVPGTHDSFIMEPNVPALAQQLRLCLDRALRTP
ncbi:MAG TPA: thioesterase domain-containing protein, partial [Candidatus Polarisedimenticolia bacterium]